MGRGFGWDLPPGCTAQDIEDAVGGNDSEVCYAYSPCGKFTCNLEFEHYGNHMHKQEVVVYSIIPPCVYCHGAGVVEHYFEGTIVCHHEYGEPGTLVNNAHAYGEFTYVTVAEWPQRKDDFDEEGNPTLRETQL